MTEEKSQAVHAPTSLEEALDILKGERKVLVSGPCRSGTTITSHILSKELNLEFIDSFPEGGESRLYAKNYPLFLEIAENEDNFVVHGPHLHPFIHLVPKDICIVFMLRKPEDILKSTKRIYKGGWNSEFYTKNMEQSLVEFDSFFFNILNYPLQSYFFWFTYQLPYLNKRGVKTILFLYNLIKTHNLYIPKRTNFTERQWR